MSEPKKSKADLKKRIRKELTEYLVIFLYLGLVFAAFIQYRRFLMAAHDITYTHYGIAAIEAAILAKVVMIGNWLGIGRRFEHKPLIYPAVFKSILFSIFVAAFTIVEHGIKGLFVGAGFIEGMTHYLGRNPHELFAGCLVIFATFIPFFALRELSRVMGEGKMVTLFFRSSQSSR